MRPIIKLGVIIGILAIIISTIVVVWFFLPKTTTYTEDFEVDLGGWIGDADVPADPNNPGSQVVWNVSQVISPAKSGQGSVELYIDGKQDDGTVWIEKEFSVRKNSQIQVTVSFDFYSESESFNVLAAVVGFVGTYKPKVEADFVVIGQANEVMGWKNYNHTATLDTGSSEEIWVAVGISVRWETEMTYNIDDMKVSISEKA